MSVEILAPAGDTDSFMAALHAGADAIYLGLKDFSARKAATNFSLDNLEGMIRRAHVFGVKVFVALNTLIKDTELPSFFDCSRRAWNCGADALILQDVFLGKLLKEQYPSITLHLSTQAGVCNLAGANLAREYGFSRVILARETRIEDIKKIAAVIETECFVQGALCTCFSGQCYFSSFVGGNSGNRGLCKQPCRKKYSVDRKDFSKLSYRLSLSDLCVGNDCKTLEKIGVHSFKIEGRLRSAAYVAASVRYYRAILDGAPDEEIASRLSDLKRSFNRGNFTRGYSWGQDSALLSPAIQGHIGEEVGRIEKFDKQTSKWFVRSSFKPVDGDGFKILRGSNTEVGGAVWKSGFAPIAGGFYLQSDAKVCVGDTVSITLDHALAQRLLSERRMVDLSASLYVAAGERIRLDVAGSFGRMQFLSSETVQQAKNNPVTEKDLRDCFEKTGEYPFLLHWKSIELGNDCFIVRSALNAFRRDVYSSVYERISSLKREPLEEKNWQNAYGRNGFMVSADACSEGKVAVIDRDFSSSCYRNVKLDYAILKPLNIQNSDEIQKFLRLAKYYAWKKYLYIPAYCIGADFEIYEKLLCFFDGIYADGICALQFAKEHSMHCIAGTGINLFNRLGADLCLRAGVETFVLSKELSYSECKRIALPEAFIFAGGSIKLMDLGHCLWGRACHACDRRFQYFLTDEAGRKFPLLRNVASTCRFELYNTVPLKKLEWKNCLYDFCALEDEEKVAYLTNVFPGTMKLTNGAAKSGVR